MGSLNYSGMILRNDEDLIKPTLSWRVLMAQRPVLVEYKLFTRLLTFQDPIQFVKHPYGTKPLTWKEMNIYTYGVRLPYGAPGFLRWSGA